MLLLKNKYLNLYDKRECCEEYAGNYMSTCLNCEEYNLFRKLEIFLTLLKIKFHRCTPLGKRLTISLYYTVLFIS